MNIIFYMLLTINGMVFVYSWYNNIKVLNKLQFFKKYFAFLDKHKNDNIVTKKKDINVIKTIGAIILYFVLAILSFAIGTSMIWIPIWIVLNNSIEVGFVSYLIISVFFLVVDTKFLQSIGKKQNDYSVVEKTILRGILKKVFAVQSILLILVNFQISFNSFMINIYTKSLKLPNSMAILLGVVYVSIFILSLYAYYKYIYLRYIDKKSKNLWKIKIWEILLVFILAAFIAMLVITETYTSYVPIDNYVSFFKTFDVIKYIFTALLIPIMLKAFENNNKYIIDEENKI